MNKIKHFLLFKISHYNGALHFLLFILIAFIFFHNINFDDFSKVEGSEISTFLFHFFLRLIFIFLLFLILKTVLQIGYSLLDFLDSFYENNFNSLKNIAFKKEVLNYFKNSRSFYDELDNLDSEKISFIVPILKKHKILFFPDLSKKYFIYVPHNHQIVTDDKKELYNCSQFYDFHNVFMFSKNSNQYRNYLMKEFKLDKNESFLKALEESLNAKRN